MIRTLMVCAMAFGLVGFGALGVGNPRFAYADSPQQSAVSHMEIAQAAEQSEDVNDPLEPLNRFFFGLNEVFQKVVLRPATEIYRIFIPPPMRDAIGNMIDNLKTPVILANDVLQGEGERAWQTTQRFLINSTIGIAGIRDAAEEMGIPKHDEDFGQTLAVWGVDEGFYVVLPLFGPSNPRDAVGKLLVDGYLDPLGLYLANTNQDAARYARLSVGAVDEYGSVVDELEQIRKTSVDYYAAVRSMYRQKRKSEINNGEEVDLPPIPDLSLELETLHEDDAAEKKPTIVKEGDQLSQGGSRIGQ
ncbi:MAG: VacJ family lipoprotein [Rhodospirillales bacterium]|nr:VacJ family lipoprotein [Rhodospirillales bacterium]